MLLMRLRMLTYADVFVMHSFRTRPMALPGVDDDDEAGAHMPHLLHYSEASSYGSQVTGEKKRPKKMNKKNMEKTRESLCVCVWCGAERELVRGDLLQVRVC